MVQTLAKYQTTGRRKSSTARVEVSQGSGKITVNKLPAEQYFDRDVLRMVIKQPFEVTKTEGKFDVRANIAGGGKSGQAGALKHGISRALAAMDSGFKTVLRGAGFLTRDPREKERKKYGRKRARRRFQYSKR